MKSSVNILEKNKTKKIFRELGLLIFLIVLCVVFQAINPTFFTWENLADMLRNTSILAILAVGMMMVMITGGIDLSVGAIVALAGMVSALTVQYVPQLPAVVAILIGMGVGIGCGAVNGVLVAKGRIIPIIATLGMMNVFRGLTYLISGSKWVSAHQMSDGFKSIATSGIGPLNTLIIIAVVVVLIFYYFLNYNRTGRYIYAVGSNPESAVITGIKKDRILIMSYTLLGLLTGLAGVLWVAKFASAQGDTATGYEMNVIAACVLGGVSVSGGTGKVGGLLLGVLLLGVLQNALPLINVSTFWEDFIQGIIILVAILLNISVKRRADKNALKRREI